jgi:hypothetical protein
MDQGKVDSEHMTRVVAKNGADIVERLKAACIGHPHARISWPHRLLHDAIAEIEALRRLNAELNTEKAP